MKKIMEVRYSFNQLYKINESVINHKLIMFKINIIGINLLYLF